MLRIQCPPCIVCKKSGEIQLTDREFQAWRSGTPIQTAAPRLSRDEAEMLITGTHGECWDSLFPDETDEPECEGCDKFEAFLDDPITQFYGVGSEMAPLFKHDCPRVN